MALFIFFDYNHFALVFFLTCVFMTNDIGVSTPVWFTDTSTYGMVAY